MRHGIVPEHTLIPVKREAAGLRPAPPSSCGLPGAPAEAVEAYLDRLAGRFLS
jgi:hypothetical protein